ncbi:MAG: DUF1097 domain-containing protein [Eubacteriaceae bacterium]|nr:DUF1097 domain-containing protein [Eubacteriaceae bacterium]
MKLLTALGISVGVLAGLWVAGCITFGLIPWIGFLSWATFYAIGGKVSALKFTVVTNLTGAIWGFAILKLSELISPLLGATTGLSVSVTIIVFIMCLFGNFSLYQFIPGQFIGAAAYFGSNFDLQATVAALLCGAVLAYISQEAGLMMVKKEPEKEVVI